MEIEIHDYLYSIDYCMATLHRMAEETKEDIVYIYNFNGQILKSTDTIDDAYKKITGKTKAEFDAKAKAMREERERKEQEFKDSIPSLIPEKRAMARGVIREDELDYWDNIVSTRLNDLYHGMELDATIELLKDWNTNHSVESVKELFLNQGHSGLSGSLVLAMVKRFAKGSNEEVDNLINNIKD